MFALYCWQNVGLKQTHVILLVREKHSKLHATLLMLTVSMSVPDCDAKVTKTQSRKDKTARLQEENRSILKGDTVTPQHPDLLCSPPVRTALHTRWRKRSIFAVTQLHLNVPISSALHTAAYQKSSLAKDSKCSEVSFWKSWYVVFKRKDNVF